MNIKEVLNALDVPTTFYQPISGGNINETYRVQSLHDSFFLKINNAAMYPSMFAKEKNGLQELQLCKDVVIPKVIQQGTAGQHQFLLLEWINAGTPDAICWNKLGSALAAMHGITRENFGFYEDNYLGTWLQKNNYTNEWSTFYSENRVLPLIKQLFDQKKIGKETMKAANNFCKALDAIFPKEAPSLLHGDLWNGNFMCTEKGYPCLYDPAVYYGHREMDIGLTKLFGGFANEFYKAYNDIFPLTTGWKKRLPFTQLYPLLFHALQFGGGYNNAVTKILQAFV